MSSDKLKDEDSSSRISYAEIDQNEADTLLRELGENIEVARALVTEITGEDPSREGPTLEVYEEFESTGDVREQTLAKKYEASKTRMRALLEEPLQKRAKAILFLKRLIQLVETRTSIDPKRITHGPEHIRSTVQLINKIKQLMGQLRVVENVIQTSLSTDDRGIVVCSPRNAGILQNGLTVASGAVRGLMNQENIPSGVAGPGDTAYMEPSQSVVDLFVKLKNAPQRISRTQEVIEIFDLLEGYLRDVVQKTGFGVELDTRFSATEFFKLEGQAAGTLAGLKMAELAGMDVLDSVKQEWEDSLHQLTYILVQLITRIEGLYMPNANDFLSFINPEELEKQFSELKKRERELTRQKVEILELEGSPIRRVGHALRNAFQSDSPQSSMKQLTAEQSALRARIIEMVRAMEMRRRLMGS